jgi:hypothetical protein
MAVTVLSTSYGIFRLTGLVVMDHKKYSGSWPQRQHVSVVDDLSRFYLAYLATSTLGSLLAWSISIVLGSSFKDIKVH